MMKWMDIGTIPVKAHNEMDGYQRMEKKKGKLTIFTSYTPGAGKSYLMISKAVQEKSEGRKIVVGYLNDTHRDIDKMLENHKISIPQNGRYSLTKLIGDNPNLVIMDEMGMHGLNCDSDTFIYEDIEKLLKSGIDVYATANLKRFDSANPLFKQVTGIGVRKTVPDKFLKMAENIYFIDRDPELMIKDFFDGKLFSEKYMKSKIMRKNFQKETLVSYRNVSRKYLEKYEDKVKIVTR